MQNFFEYYKDSGLGKWLDEKWVDISRKDKSGKHPPCGASAKKGTRKKNQKKAYPKCRPASKAAAMSDELKNKATQQKRRAETKKKHKKGRKPVWVSHENLKENAMLNESKNTPNNPKLWSKAKSLAKKKFDVYPCVPLEAKALTKTGWKNYHEIKKDDIILTYNIKEKFTEWQPIKHISFYENAETVQIRTPNTNFNFICTPDHKWVLEKTWSNNKLCADGSINKNKYRYWYDNNLAKTKDINSHMRIITSAKIKDENKKYALENFSKYQDNWVEKVINMTNEQREAFFAAAIIYDGHEKLLNEKYIGRSNRYGFSQKNHDHGDALEICATLLGYRVSFRTKNANQTMRDWTISKRDYQSTQNVNIERYQNMDVWCPTTDNQTWVMKQNGMITITGNSAYANLWASKWYKNNGGTWRKKSKNESTFVSFGDWLNNKHGNENNLNEWMSFRQANEQDANSEYTFSGTYNTETIPDLKENSKLISVEQALSIIPSSYNTQFSNTAKLEAGKSLNEENKEVVWISIEDQGVTYLFEKN